MTSITLPCGCEITETAVCAMCLPHCAELATKKRMKEYEQQRLYSEFMEGLEGALRRAHRGAT